jgi:dTDP-4-amino-4,6-dideoxygalactose transaminase
LTYKGYKIPFNKPFFSGKELFNIAQAIINGHASGDGIFTKKCQTYIERKFHAHKVLLTNSCTAALEMASLLCNIKSGDEIIMPSFTFVSTANAFFLRGAKIKFVDIRKDTLNIDEKLIENEITSKTKAIVPVHYAGVGCDMDEVMTISKEKGIFVIEDSAQAVNSKYNGKYLGTIGDIGTYSFHETKNYICGEGGAIVINRPDLVERAEIIREKGTNRKKFFRGEVDKYTWVDVGSSYLPSDILAAFLYAQLENMDVITKKRESIFKYYYDGLNMLSKDGIIRIPKCPANCRNNSHMFYIIVDKKSIRDRLISYLKEKGILAVFHYSPLHLSKIGYDFGYRKGQLPVTEDVSQRLLRLPFFYDLQKEDQDIVISEIFSFFK